MNYQKYVNIKQGSASVMRFSHGNTLPLVQRPFGMAAFAPQTSSTDSWYFHPSARCLEGVRLTHQPSPWIGDYGAVVFLPQKFSPSFSADSRWSGFRPEDAVMTPSYMKLNFLRSRAVFELTPSQRGAAVKITFSDAGDNWFSVLPVNGRAGRNYEYHYSPDENTLYASTDNNSGGDNKDFRMYFIVKFAAGSICADENICGTPDSESVCNNIGGDMTGIHLKVASAEINAFISTSYIGFEQCKENMRQDFADKTFEDIRLEADKIWEEHLSRIVIDTDNEKQLRTFYSCMYRAFLYPHMCYEISSDNAAVHYCPHDGKVHSGTRYTDNGFWDTFRTVYPFFSLVARDEYREMVQSFINEYTEAGWLPRWPSIGERGCMPSTLIDAVIADASAKGIIDSEYEELALCGMLKHSVTDSADDDFGRSGAEAYCKYGYVPLEVHKESVNLTLDAAYGDWCIARLAQKLGKNDIAEKYYVRAENYRNLFDKDSGFMRAKDKNGNFRPGFSPVSWGRDYTEGSAWQSTFAVQHDIEGLAELFGGKAEFLKKTDELFAAAPLYETTGYGAEIHEMTEMAAVDFGQCAISNQPSFHLPYIYSEMGNVEKTSAIVKKMCETVFSYEDGGFPGDEDNGSMALWYVFSTIGIYPFCPGKTEFVRTHKLVKNVKILGKEFDADKYSGNKIEYSDIIK